MSCLAPKHWDVLLRVVVCRTNVKKYNSFGEHLPLCSSLLLHFLNGTKTLTPGLAIESTKATYLETMFPILEQQHLNVVSLGWSRARKPSKRQP